MEFRKEHGVMNKPTPIQHPSFYPPYNSGITKATAFIIGHGENNHEFLQVIQSITEHKYDPAGL
jgi:hypothetical protein